MLVYTPSIMLYLSPASLLALMTILAQSLLALVGSHLVAFFLFSVWHNSVIFFV